jgi:hypothetical protein
MLSCDPVDRLVYNTPNRALFNPGCTWFYLVSRREYLVHVYRTELIPTHTAGTPMPPVNLFDAWRREVLLTLATNHGLIWDINDGNAV